MSYEADAQLREDLLQDVVLCLWQALPAFRAESSLKTFVARVAHNRAVDHVLKRQRIRDRPDSNSDPIELVPARNHQLSDRIDLTAALRRLPLPYRQCVELMLEGFTHAEIATTLGLAENTVSQRLVRGRQQLKRLLSKDDAHER